MVTVHCQQCGKEFLAKRRSAKYCSPLCRQHNYRGHRPHDYLLSDVLQSAGGGITVAGRGPRIVPQADATPRASPTFWDLMQDVLEEARLVAGSTPGAVVAASIIVMDDDAEIVREWELDGEP